MFQLQEERTLCHNVPIYCNVKDNAINSTCVQPHLLASVNAPKGLERATVDASVDGIDA